MCALRIMALPFQTSRSPVHSSRDEYLFRSIFLLGPFFVENFECLKWNQGFFRRTKLETPAWVCFAWAWTIILIDFIAKNKYLANYRRQPVLREEAFDIWKTTILNYSTINKTNIFRECTTNITGLNCLQTIILDLHTPRRHNQSHACTRLKTSSDAGHDFTECLKISENYRKKWIQAYNYKRLIFTFSLQAGVDLFAFAHLTSQEILRVNTQFKLLKALLELVRQWQQCLLNESTIVGISIRLK